MISSLTEPLLYISIAQTFFVTLLIVTKNQSNYTDRFLIGWLGCLGIGSVLNLLRLHYNTFFQPPPVVDTLLAVSNPLMLYYARSLVIPDYKFNRKEAYLLAPFIALVVGVASISFRRFVGLEPPGVAYGPNKVEFDTGKAILILTLVFAYVVFYSFQTFKAINSNQKHLEDNYSIKSEEVQLRWLKYVAIVMFASQIWIFFSLAFSWYFNENMGLYAGLRIAITTAGNVLLIYLLTYFGIKQPSLFSKYHHSLPEEAQKEEENAHAKLLNKTEAERYLAQLKVYMERDKPHIRPNLSAVELAEYLGISRHHLTELLNEHHGLNFYTFVNQYRIEEVKRKFDDRAYDHLTLLAIAYDSGFNSKSAFNLTFKQSTGQTPSAYRKQILAQRPENPS
ncbi:hypothetical protein FUAX_43860 (plasmid) [Fulvitalea axinellae]|uniref:HTH araC/xylS-type domain-containing protein n=1 Tax=Fulvitalea axinellae TaxID=1182444 RepID=A0AAU9CIJ7_9BACT|nr:hypothetical protein FUAX_43860 [Fulvitalea axinellae]